MLSNLVTMEQELQCDEGKPTGDMSVQGLLQAFDTFQARKKNNSKVTEEIFMARMACITEPIIQGAYMRRSVDVLDTEELTDPFENGMMEAPEAIPRRSITNKIQIAFFVHRLGMHDVEQSLCQTVCKVKK